MIDEQSPVTVPPTRLEPPKKTSSAPIVLASIWLGISIIAGLMFILGTRYETYGGDAYTGLQNAIARGVNALGFMLIGTGVLSLIVALGRHR